MCIHAYIKNNKGFLNTVVLFFISYSKPCSSVSKIENHM